MTGGRGSSKLINQDGQSLWQILSQGGASVRSLDPQGEGFGVALSESDVKLSLRPWSHDVTRRQGQGHGDLVALLRAARVDLQENRGFANFLVSSKNLNQKSIKDENAFIQDGNAFMQDESVFILKFWNTVSYILTITWHDEWRR